MKLVEQLWWYLREVSGESAYDKYIAQVHRDRPDDPVMCRRDFERHRANKRGHDPGSRCC